MAEPFKNWIDAALVDTAAAHLARAWRGFPRQRFVQLATTGLTARELKGRVQHVAAALAATLPVDFAAAADVIEASLAPARDDTELKALQPGPAGLAGWIVWPLTEFVAARGLPHPERALAALHALTQRLTAEFGLRPFLVAHEALTFATLQRWVRDPSPHVRRLVSEGSRPRLPWGLRLQRLCVDPSPTLPLLRELQDDPSDYVRRSVANHLNDIAKDHPDVVVDWLAAHLPDAPPARRALLHRASRTLVKRGHRGALAAWGVDAPFRGAVAFAVAPQRVAIGGAMDLQVELRAAAGGGPQRLVVDYVVRRDGSASKQPKVWKGWTVELAAGAALPLRKRHSWRPTTVRVDRPGRHVVELRINGAAVAHAAFTLRAR
jgi:3-methyladenine DNA glycosylase AlkC